MKKTIEKWERSNGLMLLGDVNTSKEVTLEEFKEMTRVKGFKGVDYGFRSGWLKQNGYEVTRENLMNTDLKSKG